MKIKSGKACLKTIKRRATWFEKRAKDDPVIKLAKEKIDEAFVEDEYVNAYAMFIDMLMHRYPFVNPLVSEDEIDVVREKYGFDWVKVEIMLDIKNEAVKEFPDEF
jgi:hypothetical protein